MVSLDVTYKFINLFIYIYFNRFFFSHFIPSARSSITSKCGSRTAGKGEVVSLVNGKIPADSKRPDNKINKGNLSGP